MTNVSLREKRLQSGGEESKSDLIPRSVGSWSKAGLGIIVNFASLTHDLVSFFFPELRCEHH